MAEEIVKVISIDTRKSERSIKDLKKDIKDLKKELESTTIGSKDFDLKIEQLGKLQREYKSINDEIVASSKPVQKQMFELARFGENLAKSYSAINAAMGLLSDGNEDVQKALLKTSQMIQLIQGLSGFAPMLRDIPKVIDKFKGLFKWVDPINTRINNMASKIAGISMNKLNALNAGGSGGNATATAGGGTTNVSADIATSQETVKRGIMPVSQALEELNGKIKDLRQAYDDAKKVQLEADEVLKKHQARYQGYAEDMERMSELVKQKSELELKWTRTVGPEADKIQKQINDTVDEMTAIWGRRQEQFDSLADFTEAAQKAGRETKKFKSDLETATAQAELYKKALSNTRWASIFINALKAVKIALASVGIGLIIAGISWLISWIPKLWQKLDLLNQKQKQLNKSIAEGANSISAKGIVALKELAERYRAVGDTAEAKKKFLVDFKEEIEKTGLAIRNVSEADDAFINNTDAYINALKQRAKAQAIESKAVELYQKYLDEVSKKENTRRGRQAAEDKKLAQDLVGAGVMTQAEADAVGTTTKLGKKLQKMEDEVEKTLDSLFEEMYELEEKSDPYFVKVEEGAADAVKATTDAKAEELATLLQFYNDAERLLMDAKERELLEVNEKYDEQIRLAEKYGQDLTVLEEARLKEIDDIHKKYYDQELTDQKARAEEQLNVLQQQIERIRQMNDTSNLQEQDQNYITKYKQGIGKAFGAGSTFFYQSAEDIENELISQWTYNNKVLALTEDRIKQENALLNKQLEIEGITAERREEIQRTLWENEMALSNAYIKNEADNIAAYQSLQEKKNAALQNSLSVASSIFGSMAEIAGEETKAGKAFAVTQAVIDTYAAANSAYASMAGVPYVGPALGIAAAAAAIASGIANVKTILSTKVSATETSVNLPSGTAVTPPALSMPPIEYTRNLLGNKEVDELNKPTKVYVLESDITDAQNRVKVTEDNASF